ncbi:DUF3060 domain-containing protein [Actinomyces sp.]|uniref:DUF3060 domain-containing protein n=1 Tax=Actinomyces sp. TaxID=29317 RepID=UPI0026DA7EAB|nr:DUF3060 domain-containing protein [Actinomyces sp.]MDO4899741.1 DUF3060 domain-containing protein [Actinomyces sp.]
MRIPNKLLVPAAVLALGASVSACSVSVGESGSAERTTAAVETTQADGGAKTLDADTSDSDDADTAGADGKGVAGTDGKDAAASGTAGITDAGWLGVIANGTQENVSGDYAIQSSGGTYNLVGELDSLAIQGSEVTVSAESIGTLTVQGSDVTVYVREVDAVQAFGSDVKVYYLDGDPTVQDIGADNTVEKLSN